MAYLPGPQEIKARRTNSRGFTKETLAEWGVAWPPMKGWLKELNKRYTKKNQADILDQSR